MKRWYALALLCAVLSGASRGQDLSRLHGGWVADVGGTRHIYYIVLRDGGVSGTYCTDCSDPWNLAFLDDGSVRAEGLDFALYHYPRDAAAYVEQVQARLHGAKLQLRIEGADGRVRELALQRAPAPQRAAQPASAATAATAPAAAPRPVYVPPGAPETITPAAITGLWLSGSGPRKQHFMFREHKGGLRGLACGPCDSVADFGPLERIRVEGNTLHFDIVHEDNGLALAEHGPHSNVAAAQLAQHELHLQVIPSYEGPDFTPIEMTLLGPVRD